MKRKVYKLANITEIIVHCTANTPYGGTNANSIRDYHINVCGYGHCGYHYIIDEYGVTHQMLDLNVIGCHCLRHNDHSIGIAYIGGVDRSGAPVNSLTVLQLESLSRLIHDLMSKFNLTYDDIHVHNEYSEKACPCFTSTWLRHWLNAYCLHFKILPY